MFVYFSRYYLVILLSLAFHIIPITSSADQLIHAVPKKVAVPKIFGELFIDSTKYIKDNESESNKIKIKRGIIGVKSSLNEKMKYTVSFKFKNKEANLYKAYMDYKLNNLSKFTVGYFKIPFSISQSTGFKNVAFLNRPNPIVKLGISEKIGVKYNISNDDNYSFTIGASTEATNYSKNSLENSSKNNYFYLRTIWAPIKNYDSYIHLGLSNLFQNSSSSMEKLTPKVSKEISNPTNRSTHFTDDKTNNFSHSFEFAFKYKKIFLQSEYIINKVSSNIVSDFNSNGYYVSLSYLFNANKVYSTRNGNFKTKLATNDEKYDFLSHLELTSRYSSINMKSDNISTEKTGIITLGANYYFNEYTSIMVNYSLSNRKLYNEDLEVIDKAKVLSIRFCLVF